MNTINTASKGLETPRGRWFAMVVALFWASVAFSAPPPAGVAPVTMPTGGVSIDGDLVANSPVLEMSDGTQGEDNLKAGIKGLQIIKQP